MNEQQQQTHISFNKFAIATEMGCWKRFILRVTKQSLTKNFTYNLSIYFVLLVY